MPRISKQDIVYVSFPFLTEHITSFTLTELIFLFSFIFRISDTANANIHKLHNKQSFNRQQRAYKMRFQTVRRRYCRQSFFMFRLQSRRSLWRCCSRYLPLSCREYRAPMRDTDRFPQARRAYCREVFCKVRVWDRKGRNGCR